MPWVPYGPQRQFGPQYKINTETGEIKQHSLDLNPGVTQWNDLVEHAKWSQSQNSKHDKYSVTNGQHNLTFLNGKPAATQFQLGPDGALDWDGAYFATKSDPTAPEGYGTRYVRNSDGTVGRQYYKLDEGVPLGMLAVLAAPFVASALGAGTASAGAASGASAAGAGAAGAGAAEGLAGLGGWISAEGGAGYLGGLAADASALGAASAGAAGAAGGMGSSGWVSGYDLVGGASLPTGASSAGGGGMLSAIGDKIANASLTDWINAAGTVGGMVGANKAAGAQVDASRDAIAESRRQYDLTRSDMLGLLAKQEAQQKPWYDTGVDAINKLRNGFDIKADPSYQFRMNEGMKALQNSAAARGGLLSGSTMKGLTDYSQGLASTEYGNQWNRLASLAGVGQTAANNMNQAGSSAYGTIANAGANSSAQIGNNLIGAGNARASGYVGAINALNSGVGQWYNNNQSNRLMDLYSKQYGL